MPWVFGCVGRAGHSRHFRDTYSYSLGIAPIRVLQRFSFQQCSSRFLLIYTHLLLKEGIASELEPDVTLDGPDSDWDGKTKGSSAEPGQENCSSKQEQMNLQPIMITIFTRC